MARHATVSLGAARSLAFKGRLQGSDTTDLSGNCTEPRYLMMRGAGSPLLSDLGALEAQDWDYADGYGYVPGKELRKRPPGTHSVYIMVRCRKCASCLEQSRRQWTARAIVEVRQCPRTWFGTLTVGPERRFWAKAVASRSSELRRAEPFAMLTATERTKEIAKVLMPEVTRYLKRVRKQSGATLRYLLVCEAHADGFPHFHLLVHERCQSVTKRTLEGQWTFGFSQWRLIDPGNVKAVGYVCKYISKSPQTRVRSSLRYGQADVGFITERVSDALHAVGKQGKRELPVQRENPFSEAVESTIYPFGPQCNETK